MTKWLSHRMVERGIIKEEEQELYQFGIRNGMILLLNVVTALVIGLLTEQLRLWQCLPCLLWFFAVIPVDITQTAGFSVILVLLWCCWFRFIHRLCFTRHRWHGCWQYCWCPQGSFFYSVPCTARTGSWIKRNKSILAEKQG